MILPEGGNYVGEPNGQGTMTLSDGANYVGEFKNGKPNGQGTMTLPDGTKYIGEWKNGKPNGQGTEITTDGSKFVGEFKDDSFLNGTFYDKEGNIKSKMLNGKFNKTITTLKQTPSSPMSNPH